MPKIRLLEIDEELDIAFRTGVDAFQRRYAVRAELALEYLPDVIGQTLKLHRQVPRESPFCGYLSADVENSTLVGACGFVSGPKEGASVEMAYYTFPPFEGRGYATAVAREMIALTRASKLVRCVFAHTLPQRNASCRVLEKVGMRFAGEVMHPEDGLVWRWEQSLE